MARKRYDDDVPQEHHERWLISYADLITLLFAFFVVMYAVSSVNDGKVRSVSNALTTAFGGAPRTINPVQVGNQQVQGGGWDSPSVIKSGTRIGPSAGRMPCRTRASTLIAAVNPAVPIAAPSWGVSAPRATT